MQATVPEFKIEPHLEPDEQFVATAVFCRGDYQRAENDASCNHWVPALPKEQVSYSELALEQWGQEASDGWHARLKELEKQRARCGSDEALLASVENEIDIQKNALENFLLMQKQIYSEHGLLCRHVQGDGNCGVYLLLTLIKDISPDHLTIEDMRAFRTDLQVTWDQLAHEPQWQKVWMVLRQHLGSNEVNGNPLSPEKADNGNPLSPDPPFTPDKVKGKRRLLPKGGVLTVLTMCHEVFYGFTGNKKCKDLMSSLEYQFRPLGCLFRLPACSSQLLITRENCIM